MTLAPRRLLSRLRDLRARAAAPLPELVRLVAAELVSEVCSVYVQRPGDILELAATEGLNPNAIGNTRLRVVNASPDAPPLGVGECAAGPTAAAIGNALADALGVRVRDLPLTPERLAAVALETPPDTNRRP